MGRAAYLAGCGRLRALESFHRDTLPPSSQLWPGTELRVPSSVAEYGEESARERAAKTSPGGKS